MCGRGPSGIVYVMTTTEYPPPPNFPTDQRRLRRSQADRVGAGVAGGLSEYFGVDPVLFRVLFATSAFFGGAGILAYLLFWATMPDAGTESAAVDRWIATLRRRRVPFWIVAVGAGILLWLVAFSWWAPGRILPVTAVVVVLIFALSRGGRRPHDAAPMVNLTKGDAPAPVPAARGWLNESLAAGRIRRRRAAPVRLSTLGVLAVTLIVIAFVDSARGVVLTAYLWPALGIVLAGLLVGAILRRTPWSLATLLVPIVAGLIAFAGTHASLHDGTGQKQWRPTVAPAADYRLAIGQGTLDLRKLAAQQQARAVSITMAAGQVRILAPKTLNLTVDANIRFGVLTIDGQDVNDPNGSGGFNFNQTIDPPAGATGAPVTVQVHLADGNVDIVRS